MLWNWDVLDACFMSASWHIYSKAMFGGSCIGVVVLAILLEFLRRAGKEYDRFIVAQHGRMLASSPTMVPSSPHAFGRNGTNEAPGATTAAGVRGPTTFVSRPNISQQATRALLHMCQFAVGYCLVLLAMYYNGYIVICIFISVYIGCFVFGWESLNVRNKGDDCLEENINVCCG